MEQAVNWDFFLCWQFAAGCLVGAGAMFGGLYAFNNKVARIWLFDPKPKK